MAAERESSSDETKTKRRTPKKRTKKKQDDAPTNDEQTASPAKNASSADADFGDGIESNDSKSSGSTDSGERDQNRRESRPRRRRRGGSRSSERSQGTRGSGQGQGGNRGGGGSDRRRRSNNSNQNSNRNSRGNRSRNSGRNRSRSQTEGDRSSREPKEIEITGTTEGVLELHPKGYGFIRDKKKDYLAQEYDPFVSSALVEKYGLREGIYIVGEIGPGIKNQGPRLYNIKTIDDNPPEEFKKANFFDDLTAVNPFEQIKLETGPKPVTMRVMDLLTPLGKGQRALLVAPPRTGKTMLLQDIANAVSVNHPEIHLIVLLIDERPEEVTEMRRSVNGEVIASSMDNDVESHIRVSQLVFERGKRLAESGKDVLILLDSITRTARAFNKWINNTGRTMSGGLDVKAMDIPKKMFGTARRFDEGGSLTVVGTALIDTGSRMDEVIFQEFKGTGNMELVLSRNLADRRIWPAIDITKSGTRREEKIIEEDALDSIILLRRSLISLSPVEAMEQLTRTLERFSTNSDFLAKVRDIL